MKRNHGDRDTSHSNREKQTRLGDNRGQGGNVCKQLRVHPLSQFEGNFPFFREPKPVGTFSQDSQRKFHHNSQELRYFSPPPDYENVNFDLRAGFREARLRDDSVKELLDDLLRWVLLNKSKFQLSGEQTTPKESLNTDFICWRGLLTKILCTPYENREGWMIAVIRHADTWYMCEYDTPQRQQQKTQQTEKEKEMTYWGYKFEQYLTSEKDGGQPDTTGPVSNYEGFGLVVRSRLKNHSLVYGGEVDCCETDGQREEKYVELKTSRELYQQNNMRNFKRFKLIKWWAQSFLLGVPKIVAGFRDDDGVVQRLENFKTLEIPKMIRDIRDPWEPNVCFNFLDHFLDLVKRTVTENDYRVAYVFRWSAREPVTAEKCPADSGFSFLPKWYIDGAEPPT